MKRIFVVLAAIILLAEVFFCRKMLPKDPEPEDLLAEPLEGLTPEQLALFSRGDANFAHAFSREEGLGPIFAQTSCQNCHAGDGKGNPFNMLTRFGNYQNGAWDPMYSQGGPQLQAYAITGYESEEIPEGAEHADFLPANVTGLGFLEAVADSTLLAMPPDSLDLDGDGISGRVNWISPPSFFTPRPIIFPRMENT